MDNEPDAEYILTKELCDIEYKIHCLENESLEYHKKIEENSKKMEELYNLLKEKEAILKKVLEEKEEETKRRFEQAEKEYYATTQATKLAYIDKISNSDWSSVAASARCKAETKLIQGLIFEVDSEGQTDKLPPKKSKWEF